MVNKKIKSSFCLLSAGAAFSLSYTNAANAVDWSILLPNAVSSFMVSAASKFVLNMRYLVSLCYDSAKDWYEVKKYGGFRSPLEIKNRLVDIVENRSEIKVYGQKK